jgi:hypothetical protein
VLFGDGGVNINKIMDLGDGPTLHLDMPAGSGPDACRFCASIIKQLGVPVGAQSLSALTAEELREVTAWATTELLRRRLEVGELRRDPMPLYLARTMRPVVQEADRRAHGAAS